MSAPIKAGDLRHRIVIESPMPESDGAGGATVTWTAVVEVWAAVWSRGVGEKFVHDRVSGSATHDIWLRFRDDVKPKMRMRFGTRTFDILGAIDVDDRKRWLKCPVEERDL